MPPPSTLKRKIEEIGEAETALRRLSDKESKIVKQAPSTPLACTASKPISSIVNCTDATLKGTALEGESEEESEESSSEDDSSDSDDHSTSDDDDSDTCAGVEDDNSDQEEEDEEEDDVIPPPLHSRLKAFLPQLAAANASLLSNPPLGDSGRSDGFEILAGEREAVVGEAEDGDEAEGKGTYIEMELDLGILEDKGNEGGGEDDVLLRDGIAVPRSGPRGESEGGNYKGGRALLVGDAEAGEKMVNEKDASAGVLETLLGCSPTKTAKGKTAPKAKIVEIL